MAFAVGLGGTASAQTPTPPMPPTPPRAPTPPPAPATPDAALEERIARMFAQMDQNQDGRIVHDEWSGAEEEFARLDANQDGAIDADELGKGLAEERAPGERGRGRGEGRRGGGWLRRLDQDQDGKLSKTEWPGAAELFDQLDGDKDGSLSEAEVQAADPQVLRRVQTQARMKQMDLDGDGKIGREEWQGPEEMFARLDANQDGAITEEEMLAGNFGRGEGGRRPDGQPGQPGEPGQPGQRGGEQFRARMAERLKQLDTDGDGVVTREEWQGSERLFERLDANGDGKIDATEMAGGAPAPGAPGTPPSAPTPPAPPAPQGPQPF